MATVTIEVLVTTNVKNVWNSWTDPTAIMQWNFASNDWHCPHASNNLVVGGRLLATMAAKNKSAEFEFGGTYTAIVPLSHIEFKMDDGRQVIVRFEKLSDNTTKVIESFDAENENTIERQRAGWMAILTNFKKYCERG